MAAYFHRGFDGEPVNHWLVVNPYRPFNETAGATVAMAEEIERRSRLPITGMIANPHLINETTPELVRSGLARIREITRYPVVCLSVMEPFNPPGAYDDLGVRVLVLRKQMKQPWEPGGIMMSGRKRNLCP